MQTPLSLKQLNEMVSSAVSRAFTEGVWVMGEINSLQERGHCYLELIEKDPDTESIVAKASATIWRNVYIGLKLNFYKAVQAYLAPGMKVLVRVRPTFHPQYGFSLNITDIDPSYTLGDAALRRAAVVKRLKDEGVYDLNREVPLPLLIKRIAVISASQAAGYGDFMNHIESNPYGYKYSITLFEASMQGDSAEASIIAALDAIALEQDMFDVVAIVRGGGAVSDLSCYDRYALASCVAQFPLPVLAGIGHDRDVSVVDEVAGVRLKTPTAVADFIIESTFNAHQRLNDVLLQFSDAVNNYIQNHVRRIEMVGSDITSSARLCMERHKGRISMSEASLKAAVSAYLAQHNHKLEIVREIIELSSPVNILKKGYSITMKNGVPVRASMLNEGDEIETLFADGKVSSTILRKQ